MRQGGTVKWRDTARGINVRVSRLTAHAMDYLEAQGLRFCIEFGTENAVDMATDHWLGTLDDKSNEQELRDGS